MYSPAAIARRITIAERDLGRPLIYHTLAEVNSFEDHLTRHGRYVLDKDGQPTSVAGLTLEESHWIENELALVQCDAEYALTRYCWLVDEIGNVARFSFRLAQRILYDVMADLESRGLSIEIMILKARQLGMTTVVQLLTLLRIMFGYGVNAIAASAEQDKSALMADKLFMAFDQFPVWLRPTPTSRQSEGDKKRLAFGQLHTLLSVQHGNKLRGGIAQGWTPTVYHISEVALMLRPEVQLDEGLFKAVHPAPSILGVLESTGTGDDGWWAETWHYSKANWPQSRLYPLFLPWVCGLEIYPMPADLAKSPVPVAWHKLRLPDTREHVARVEAYVHSHPIIRDRLCRPHPELPGREHWWVDGRMPLEQQWFWEIGHQEAKSKGQEGLWYQGMAGDDVEALQRSSESVFGHNVLVEVEDRAVKEFTAWGLSGQSIEDDHEPPPEDIDYGSHSAPRMRIPVLATSPRGDVYRWELIPLHHSTTYLDSLRTKPDAYRDYANGKLFVYRPPAPGVQYSIGVDTSNGIGDDSTVICVTELPTRPGLPDQQAAEFRSAYVSHVEAYAFIMAISTYYGQYMEATTPFRQPIIGVEQIAAVGDVAQVQLRKMGHGRFPPFIRYDGKSLDKSKSRKFGWYTNSWSRPILVDSFVHSVQNGWYIINSPWLIDECRHFEVHYTAAGKEKKEHDASGHDDGIFAAAISEIIVNDLKSMAERTKKRFMGDLSSQHLPPIDVSPFCGTVVSSRGDRSQISMNDVIFSSSAELERWR